MEVKKGDRLFSIKQKTHSISFSAPLSGKIVAVNKMLTGDFEQLDYGSYGKNNICTLEATNLENELSQLKIGQAAVDFFNDDISRLKTYIEKYVTSTEDENKIPADGHVYLGELEVLKDKDYNAVVNDFFMKPVVS